MLFPTIDFAVFFVVVLTASWLLRPRRRAWRLFLLAASAVFYLDPFNPVHSGGERFVIVNPVILAVVVGLGVVTARLLRAAFGVPAGIAPAPDPADPAEPEPGPGPEGPDAGGGPALLTGRSAGVPASTPATPDPSATAPSTTTTTTTTATTTAPARTPALVVWAAPVTVTALVAGACWWAWQTYPERVDQNARWLLLLIGLALVNQAFARAVAAARPAGAATSTSRRLVVTAVAVDLAVLGWFKYAGWFAEMWTDLASRVGIRLEWLPGVVLPIAISFVTFQAISYVVDVGRGTHEPVGLLDFTVYLTFFAHVVAGPIVRVREFVPQLADRADPRHVVAGEAFELIFRGLFKKVVISSYVATQIVQPVLEAPAGHGRLEVAAAVAGYAVQIYADFSGYTDIAIGVALLLGIRFPVNFDAPYRAVSLQDFWRRWHITLSRWLRDYVYIPLGGNRSGPSRTQVNLVLTMLLGGLWHGANGTFVVWGAIHGLGLAAERRVKAWWAARPAGPLGVPLPLVRVLQWAATMVVVGVAWVFFAARDVGSALAVLGQLVVGEAAPGAPSRVTPVLVAVLAGSLAAQFVPPEVPRRLFDRLVAAPPLVQAAAGAVALFLLVVLGPEGVAPFIYFQF